MFKQHQYHHQHLYNELDRHQKYEKEAGQKNF